MTKTKWYQKPLYTLVALALVVSLGIVALPMAGTVEASPVEWYVDDDSPPGGDGTTPEITGAHRAFHTIGVAVTAAGTDDTINVAAGTYNENVLVNKPVVVRSVSGASVTIVEAAASNKPTFEVTAGQATVEGFSSLRLLRFMA